jgi:hypothetical protein
VIVGQPPLTGVLAILSRTEGQLRVRDGAGWTQAPAGPKDTMSNNEG